MLFIRSGGVSYGFDVKRSAAELVDMEQVLTFCPDLYQQSVFLLLQKATIQSLLGGRCSSFDLVSNISGIPQKKLRHIES